MYINCHLITACAMALFPLNELVNKPLLRCETMALTDINTVTGIYDFIKECKLLL
jgi:DNA polymerase-3 subunit alpha/error-prone DNA polymerase